MNLCVCMCAWVWAYMFILLFALCKLTCAKCWLEASEAHKRFCLLGRSGHLTAWLPLRSFNTPLNVLLLSRFGDINVKHIFLLNIWIFHAFALKYTSTYAMYTNLLKISKALWVYGNFTFFRMFVLQFGESSFAIFYVRLFLLLFVHYLSFILTFLLLY